MTRRVVLVCEEPELPTLREDAARRGWRVVAEFTPKHSAHAVRRAMRRGADALLCATLRALASNVVTLARLLRDIGRAGGVVAALGGDTLEDVPPEALAQVSGAFLRHRAGRYGETRREKKSGVEGVRCGPAIARALAEGCTTRDICAALHVAPGTVTKVRRILREQS